MGVQAAENGTSADVLSVCIVGLQRQGGQALLVTYPQFNRGHSAQFSAPSMSRTTMSALQTKTPPTNASSSSRSVKFVFRALQHLISKGIFRSALPKRSRRQRRGASRQSKMPSI